MSRDPHADLPSARSGGRWPHPIAALAFFAGAVLANSFLKSSQEWPDIVVVATATTILWLAAGLRSSGAAALRWVGWAAAIALLGFYALWVYLALAFGLLLAWTVPAWGWALVAVSAVAAVLTLARPRQRLHVPLVLPLGIWIAVVLSGWLREEYLVRCDDFLALEQPVELVVPTQPDLASCRPGEIRQAGRFPRTIWQAPDGKRVVFTTQGAVVPGGLSGALCEASLGSAAAPTCVGPPINKSQGLIDLTDQGRLLAMQWGLPTPRGTRGAVVYELATNGGLAILAEHWFEQLFGEGFYEPRNSTLYMFSDEMNGIYPAVLPGYELLPTIPIEFAPGELHYDMAAGEGVACGSHTGAAIRGDPFAFRFFVDRNSPLLEQLSVSWGCDWDRSARTVYSTIPNLGLLDKIDYDSGRVTKHWFVGPGMRSVEYDRARRRVYFTDFLRGYVLAFDEQSEQIVGRWFVGRFSRWVRLTPDGRALLATGNLGIVRIPLE